MTGRIAVLGGGVIGEAFVRMLLQSGHAADQIVISEWLPDRASDLRSAYGVAVEDNATAVSGAEVVLVAVKPDGVVAVLREIREHLSPGAIVVSLAAGVPLSALESALSAGAPVVRAMPNTPVLVGAGTFGVSAGSSCHGEQLQTVLELLELGGTAVVVDESDQDALTAVSGSGPAYLFYLAEAMILGGIRVGLREEVARKLTRQTLLGASALLEDSVDSEAELRRRVTSPGGTTAAATAAFDAAGMMDSLAAGIEAACDRSRSLSHAARHVLP